MFLVIKGKLWLIPLIMGLKTLRGALAANLYRVMICTPQVPLKKSYLEFLTRIRAFFTVLES